MKIPSRRTFLRTGAVGAAATCARPAWASPASALTPAQRSQLAAFLPATAQGGSGGVPSKAFQCQVELGTELILAAAADGFPLFFDLEAAVFAIQGFSTTIAAFHQNFPSTPATALAGGVLAAYQYIDVEAPALGLPPGFYPIRLVATSPVQLGTVELEAQLLRGPIVAGVTSGFAILAELGTDPTQPPAIQAGVGVNVAGFDPDGLNPPTQCKQVYGKDSKGNEYCWDTCGLTPPP
ncbi:MAG: hypothetical protein AAFZ65_01380 [Planctomycetota bacterium]